MILRLKDIHEDLYVVKDCEGKEIPDVVFYDTKSKKISIYLKVSTANSVNFISDQSSYVAEPRQSDIAGRKLISFTLEGSYAEDINGRKIDT